VSMLLSEASVTQLDIQTYQARRIMLGSPV
jgi:hypothetical protein